MAIEGTNGPDNIEIKSTLVRSPTTETVNAKGGDDRITFHWSEVDDDVEPGYERKQFDVDGGTGLDTLVIRLHYSDDESYYPIVDPRGGSFEEVDFTSIERVEIYGGDGGNLFYGLDGNDVLDGAGGTDALHGGKGDDTYYVNLAGDKIVEKAEEGHDTARLVRDRVSYELPANVEDLIIISGSGGFGNELDNEITGNGGVNKLYGRGGSDTLRGQGGDDILNGGIGVDTMYGGDGNDLMVVDERGEGAFGGAGTDTVESSVSHALRDGTERLTLTGTAAINGSGNELDNLLRGNEGANILSGLDGDDRLDGGAGADKLRGGDGDDRYYIDNRGDTAEESDAAGGTDTVFSTVSFSLGANIENLTLAGRSGISGTGNGEANTILGNSAANVLRGDGGADRLQGEDGADRIYGGDGADRIYGGRGNDILRGDEAGGPSGADRFYFNTSFLNTSNVDQIVDFNPANDLIILSENVFTQLDGPRTLSADNFRVGAAAADADDFIVYDRTTGKLFYDPDGAGSGLQVQFASVTAGTDLTNLDFYVYG